MGENETLRFTWLQMVHSIASVMLKQQFFEIETDTNKKCHSHVTNAPKGIGQA